MLTLNTPATDSCTISTAKNLDIFNALPTEEQATVIVEKMSEIDSAIDVYGGIQYGEDSYWTKTNTGVETVYRPNADGVYVATKESTYRVYHRGSVSLRGLANNSYKYRIIVATL